MIHRGSENPHRADPAPAATPRLIDLGVALALVFVTVLTFLPGLDGAFLDWDDRENFLHNPHFRGLCPAQPSWSALKDSRNILPRQDRADVAGEACHQSRQRDFHRLDDVNLQHLHYFQLEAAELAATK